MQPKDLQPKDSILVSESFFVQKFSNGECTVDLSSSSDGATITLSVDDFETVASAVTQASDYLQARYDER